MIFKLSEILQDNRLFTIVYIIFLPI